MKKYFIIILIGLLQQCKTSNSINLSSNYYSINTKTSQYFRLHFINDSTYELRNKDCISNEHFGVYQILKKENKIILFDDDFYVIPYDTIVYEEGKLNQFYLGNYIFKNFSDTIKVSIPYILNKKRYLRKIRLDTMFSCKPVIIKNTPPLVRDSIDSPNTISK